jgi:hypothetical protein
VVLTARTYTILLIGYVQEECVDLVLKPATSTNRIHPLMVIIWFFVPIVLFFLSPRSSSRPSSLRYRELKTGHRRGGVRSRDAFIVETMPITKRPARRESPRSSARRKATVGAKITKGQARRESPRSSARKKAKAGATSEEKKKQQEEKKKQKQEDKKKEKEEKDARYHDLQQKRGENSPRPTQKCGQRGKGKNKNGTPTKNLAAKFKEAALKNDSDYDSDATVTAKGNQGTDKKGKEEAGEKADVRSGEGAEVNNAKMIEEPVGGEEPGESGVEENDDTESKEVNDAKTIEKPGEEPGESGVDKDTQKDKKEKSGKSEKEVEENDDTESKEDEDKEKKEHEKVALGTPETPRQVPATGGQQVVDIVDTPPPPPVVHRFAKYKNGNEVECIATLPGFEYHSDDMDDAVFDKTQGEPPYVKWTVDLKEEMSASKALVTRYGDFFTDKNLKTMKDEKVTAKVGTQQLRVSDLKTLAPGTWLNDNVVDLMTQVLATLAIHRSRREVAVFDTQFTKLILKTPRQPTTTGAGMEYCKYDTVVDYADKGSSA